MSNENIINRERKTNNSNLNNHKLTEICLKNEVFMNTDSIISEKTKNSLQKSEPDERKKGKWTKDEDEVLERVVSSYGQKNWKKVSEFVKGRTPIQCLHRWTKILKPGLIKGPWTIEQDRKLLDWVNKEGPCQWSQCAEFISGRSGKQCRERWFNTLNPKVKKGNWTAEEDFIIFDSYRQFGSLWTKISEKLSGRTENSIKNRFYSTLRRISSSKKNHIENISSSLIPLNKLVEYLPEALVEKTMNFIKYKNLINQTTSEKQSTYKEKDSTSININQELVNNNPQNSENEQNCIYNMSNKIGNNTANVKNITGNFNNYCSPNFQPNFLYNIYNSYPMNNGINEVLNIENSLKLAKMNNSNIYNNNYNQFYPCNSSSNIYNPINNSCNVQNNNVYKMNNQPNNSNEANLCNINMFPNRHEEYNQMKELPLEILENNIENLCERNPFNEPNLSILDNQINDFIENFFESSNLQEENNNKNIICFGCNDNKKDNVIKIDNLNDNKSKDKVLNSLLDQLNELEKLLQSSKSELINKMNNNNNNNAYLNKNNFNFNFN